MPLVKAVAITQRARWRSVLAAIFKGSSGKQLELGISETRSAIGAAKMILPSRYRKDLENIDSELAKVQSQGAEVVIFSLYPVDTVPPIKLRG